MGSSSPCTTGRGGGIEWGATTREAHTGGVSERRDPARRDVRASAYEGGGDERSASTRDARGACRVGEPGTGVLGRRAISRETHHGRSGRAWPGGRAEAYGCAARCARQGRRHASHFVVSFSEFCSFASKKSKCFSSPIKSCLIGMPDRTSERSLLSNSTALNDGFKANFARTIASCREVCAGSLSMSDFRPLPPPPASTRPRAAWTRVSARSRRGPCRARWRLRSRRPSRARRLG